MNNVEIKSLDMLFQETGFDPFEKALKDYKDQQAVDLEFDSIVSNQTDNDFRSIVSEEFTDSERVLVPDEVIPPSAPTVAYQPSSIQTEDKQLFSSTSPKRFRRVGGGALKFGTVAAVVAVGLNVFSGESTENSARAVDVTIEEPAVTTEPNPANIPITTQAEQVSNTIVDASTTSTSTTSTSTTSTTTTSTTPETTIPERAPTILESVALGERKLEEIMGTKVGTLSIDGICLDNVDVSVINAADPVHHPEIMDGFDWSIFNTNPELPVIAEGDLEAARARLNPEYRLITDETPQQACEFAGISEHLPRWERHTSGSRAAVNNYRTPSELVPQADIHPYSALPGETGVTYVQGHRTTESAPFLNLDALVLGQTASFNDGFNTFNYVFVGYETVSPNISIEDVMKKTIDGKSTLIVSTCDDGSAVRLLAKFTLQA